MDFFRISSDIIKKRAPIAPAVFDALSNKKKIYMFNEVSQKNLAEKKCYFWPLFGEYLRSDTWYRPENFTTASSHQYQQMLKIARL